MNKNIIKSLLSLAAVALMWGCETGYYNENYLDGYQNNNEITDVRNLELTLDADHYAAIAKNSTNKSIAQEEGDEAVSALNSLSKNHYFASADYAAMFIPAYLDQLYPTYDNGSVALVNYTLAVDVPANVVAMNAATEYTLTEDDYKTIWNSETDYVSALTPSTVNKLKSVLVATEGMVAGDYVAVTYNYSASEPATDDENEGGENEGEQPAASYTSVLGSAVLDDVVEVRGYISAVSSQGPIVTDNGGSVILYKATGLEVGDEVTVNGTITAYNCGFQLDTSKGATFEKTGTVTTAITYPTPVEITGAMADELLTSRTENEYAQFVKIVGTTAISGNYYNLNLEGAETAVGSYYGLTDEQKAKLTDGELTTVYGYFFSISKSSGAPKYINFIVTHINEEPAVAPANDYTTVLGTAVLNDVVEVKGYISAVSAQGPILTDNGGSVLLYKTTGYEIGDEVTVNGTITSYNKGFQIGTTGLTIEKTGTTTVTYPTAVELTGAMADELLTSRVEDEYAQYVKISGTASVSGNYYNFNIDGATTAVGSFYGLTDAQKAVIADGGHYTIYGYFVTISVYAGAPKYINFITVALEENTPTATTFAAKVTSEKKYAFFKYNGTAFEATDIVAVQPAEMTEMGQTYGSFTNPQQDNYLPKYLAQKYPYAQDGKSVYVAYRCYANSVTSWKVDHYTYTTEWSKVIYFESKTDQFRKGEGKWNIDRTLELNLPNGDAFTKSFYQYCVNWVYDNKDVALGAPARDNAGVIITTDIVNINGAKPSGNYWVSNYGNNEFYTGASAYYGNMDWRVSAVRGGFTAAGMGELTDEQIQEKLKEHTAEVFGAVLSCLYPDMTPEEYKKVVINFYVYGPNVTYTCAYTVTGTGAFEYVADSMVAL
ncbi:MAG: TetR family transcriptional regulator C-terminal domain-containing protein [Alistipes sp.]|nr:TetR family transcriptional regulator C-terminal domain-containing protein [Alistipes sp.]